MYKFLFVFLFFSSFVKSEVVCVFDNDSYVYTRSDVPNKVAYSLGDNLKNIVKSNMNKYNVSFKMGSYVNINYNKASLIFDNKKLSDDIGKAKYYKICYELNDII